VLDFGHILPIGSGVAPPMLKFRELWLLSEDVSLLTEAI
jgi:hypothetical protein